MTLVLNEGDPPSAVTFRADGYRDLAVTLNPRDVVAAGRTALRYEMARVEPAFPRAPKARAAIEVKTETVRPATERPQPIEKPPVAPKAAPKPAPKPKLNWDE
jgi:hypothetical protein